MNTSTSAITHRNSRSLSSTRCDMKESGSIIVNRWVVLLKRVSTRSSESGALVVRGWLVQSQFELRLRLFGHRCFLRRFFGGRVPPPPPRGGRALPFSPKPLHPPVPPPPRFLPPPPP